MQARLFGPGLAAAGQACDWQPDTGLITWPTGETRLPAVAGGVRIAGFDLQGLELSWADDAGGWALQVLDAADASQVRAAPPAGWQAAFAQLAGTTRRHRGGRAIGWSALALFIAAPLLMLAAFFVFADDIAGWVASRVPQAQEETLGDASFKAMQATLKLRDDGESARIVREIGGRLTTGSSYRYRFHVVDDAAINAFAMPGGIVVVHSGLIAATRTPEELAGVLAHEVQHIELRHSLKALIKQTGLSALWALATGDLGGALAGEAAQRMMSLGFSRDAEREADSAGFDALLRAGIDPAGMPAFFDTLAKQAGSAPELLSTHPASGARSDALASRLTAVAGQRFEPLPYRPWPPAP
ncbi:M48 family metallopeptidase [Uliginosibacterium sp. H1]|uniref:M48 family metallopeptidase n=1 Tax=Uliginosibacterium sp. H1 TaxID=3114757 RepID=UPI002E19D3D6|nr:M48 family metallopeptidase [Uliginosibacterium sp. H1]